MTLDPQALRQEFPGLAGEAHGKPFVYLDSAATTQKHVSVIEAMDRFLRVDYGTVHRGMYERSVRSTAAYEAARKSVARFLGADDERQVVFTMGCTDAINLVAWSWGRANLRPGDQVLVTAMEHHADIVPWQIVGEITGAEVVACPMDDAGTLDRDAYRRLLASGRVRLVGCVHIANSLGTVNPVSELAAEAHEHGALFLCDAAQSAPHLALDVSTLGVDFLTLSAHKCYGPTGIGCLWARSEHLAAMPPWRGGGDMIDRVTFAGTTFADPPLRFEAGTPPITEAIGFAAAVEFLMALGMDNVAAAERERYARAETLLDAVPGLHRIGRSPQRSTVLSFTIDGAHPADIANVLDRQGVAIRAGHHCAQPVMDRFGIGATARISLGVYTTDNDLERASEALHKASRLFA